MRSAKDLQKEKLRGKILGIDGVTELTVSGKHGDFSSFVFKGKEFAHFHGENTIDLRLTKKVIAEQKLSHPEISQSHPNRSPKSPWIELKFNDEPELNWVFNYVVLATQQI